MATFNGSGIASPQVLVDPTNLPWTTSTDLQAVLVDLGNPSSSGNIVEVTATSYSVLATDATVLVNQAASATVAITLIAGASHNTKRLQVKDKKGTASTFPITITRSGGDTIDGATTLVLDQDYAAVELVFNGTEWSIL